MNAMIDLNLLPPETLAEMANEAAEAAEKNARVTVQKAIDAGRYLIAAKEQIEHGQWMAWVGKNWNYKSSQAHRYMQIANLAHALNLTEAKSVRDALRIIANEKADPEPDITPRAERKTGQVEVVDPDEPDDDPAPDPPTQRKTAKGSEKKPESSKPKTPPITPEIIDEPNESFPEERTLSDWSEQQILDYLVETADEPKPRAKRLRKTADRLDPPEESQKPETVPTIAKLIKAIPDDVGALRGVIERWARHKQSLQGKARVRSMESWETMIEQMLKACNAHGVSEVSESIRASIANGYIGWDIQLRSLNGKEGKGNGSAHRGTGKRGYTADEVFS